MARTTIHPVILSGGTGSRLWPLSRRAHPKQFQTFAGEATLLQATARRVPIAQGFAAPLVVCNQEHRFLVAEQLAAIGVAPAEIVLEPVGRNTAPAIAVAALLVKRADPGAIVVSLASDHAIEDAAGFRETVHRAATIAATQDRIVALGVRPTSPHTGYGYIHRGAPLAGKEGGFAVAGFLEKPDAETARTFLDSGTRDWNASIFVFRPDVLLAEMDALAPDVASAALAAIDGAKADLDFLRLDAEAFAASPSISLDHAVMEKTGNAAVVPLDVGWSDLGAWDDLWTRDTADTVTIGDVVALDTRGSYIRAESRLVAVQGIEDLVVVETSDAVLVTRRRGGQDIRRLVARLEADSRQEAVTHPVHHRPWGQFEIMGAGPGHKVKRLTIKPGAGISLQRHRRRAEHWVVVAGTARATLGEEVRTLRANESIFVPLGVVHRLENPGDGPLEVIEVQTGDYLGEDDIERFEDRYNRPTGKDEGGAGE